MILTKLEKYKEKKKREIYMLCCNNKNNLLSRNKYK